MPGIGEPPLDRGLPIQMRGLMGFAHDMLAREALTHCYGALVRATGGALFPVLLQPLAGEALGL